MDRNRDRRRFLAYEIARLRRAGHSVRQIARSLRIARKTVDSILDELEASREGGVTAIEHEVSPRVAKKSKLDAYEKKILAWLEEAHKDDRKLTANNIMKRLKAQGFDGGYSIVKSRVHELRRQLEPRLSAPRIRTAAGQRAEFDWSPYELANGQTVNLWSAVLVWSRAPYLAGADNEKQGTILTLLQQTFEAWGGVPHEVVTDTMPGVVDRWECGRPIINARFVDFANFFDFGVNPHLPRRPTGKPHVERRFRHHEGSLFESVKIYSFAEYRQRLAGWVAEEIMPRAHPESGRPIAAMLEEERPHLRALPRAPYDTRDVVICVVTATGYVNFETNKYSVPDGHVGELVYLCASRERVEICDAKARRLIEHKRLPDGAHIEMEQLLAVRRRARYDVDGLVEQLSRWGELAAIFAHEAVRSLRYPGPELQQLLMLQLEWSLDDLVAAMEHARRYGRHDAKAIQRILVAKFTPRRLEAQIADSTRRQIETIRQTHPISYRPLSSYETLRRGDQHSDGISPPQQDPADDQTQAHPD